MLWLLRWGPYLKSLIKRDNRGESTPCIQKDRPRLKAEHLWYYEGFCELSSRRVVGFSYQPITLQDIICWLDFNEIHHKSAQRLFVKMVIAMDQAWLDFYAEKNKKK